MSGFLAVAWNGFREASRNKVTMVLAAFAVVLLCSTVLVQEATVSTLARVVTDFGLGTMVLMLVPLAIYLSCGLIPREIERRTVFLIVTRPLSRTAFIGARILGNAITLGAILLAMVAVFGLELWITRTPFSAAMAASLGALYLELMVITAAGMMFSAMSSQLVSAVITVGLYFAGHLSGDIYRVAARSETPSVRWLGKAVYYLVPNLEVLNFRPMATYELPVSPGALGAAAATGVAYFLLFGIGATLIFERRDFK